MSEYYTIITNLGLAQIATAVSNNSLVNIAKIGVGDSGGNPYDPTAEQTELVNQQWIGDITNIEVDASPKKLALNKLYLKKDSIYIYI